MTSSRKTNCLGVTRLLVEKKVETTHQRRGTRYQLKKTLQKYRTPGFILFHRLSGSVVNLDVFLMT